MVSCVNLVRKWADFKVLFDLASFIALEALSLLAIYIYGVGYFVSEFFRIFVPHLVLGLPLLPRENLSQVAPPTVVVVQ